MSDKISDKRLKRCPFCGGEAELVGFKYYWVDCKKCHNGTQAYKTEKEAIQAWNTRKPVDDVVEALEKRLEEQFKLYAIAFDPEDRGGYDAYNDAIEIVKEHLT